MIIGIVCAVFVLGLFFLVIGNAGSCKSVDDKFRIIYNRNGIGISDEQLSDNIKDSYDSLRPIIKMQERLEGVKKELSRNLLPPDVLFLDENGNYVTRNGVRVSHTVEDLIHVERKIKKRTIMILDILKEKDLAPKWMY